MASKIKVEIKSGKHAVSAEAPDRPAWAVFAVIVLLAAAGVFLAPR